MPNPVSRWRYELLALTIALIGAVLHWGTNTTIVGVQIEAGNLVHRAVAQLEGRATDFRFRLRGPRAPHPDVVVVAIDERSVQRYGLWPWSRAHMASALQNLLDADVKAIGMDVTFADETRDESALSRELLAELQALDPRPPQLGPIIAKWSSRGLSPDEALEAALRKGGQRIVQGSVPFGDADAASFDAEHLAAYERQLEPVVIRSLSLGTTGATRTLPVETMHMWTNVSAQMPLERFVNTGTRIGHFSMVNDVDGTVRRIALFSRLTKPLGLLPAMSLQTAAQSLGALVEPAWNGGESDLQGAQLKMADGSKWLVPFEPNSSFTLINYDGPGSIFPTVSVLDVAEDQAFANTLRGKTVLIGSTIVGSSGDQRVTPFKEHEPGVFTHAAMVSNILSRRFLTRARYSAVLEVLAMLVLCMGFAAAIARTSSFVSKALLAMGGAGLWLAVSYGAFVSGSQVATVVPVATLLASSFGTIFLGYLSVDREKLKMRSTFTRYLGEDVMEVALADPDLLNRGEKREMTVMFSDIRGFTTLSERMSPEMLASFINEYLSPMTKIVFDEKGTLDKYIGDAVMAFWNAPLTQPDHALRACRACVKMLIKLEELKSGWRAKGLPELEIGIGLNSGPMIVGNMGSDVRVDYTVLGDSVNLASRLEGTNKEYDTKIIVAESTWAAVKDAMVCRRLGSVRVKGKRQPVSIFELRGEGQPAGDEKLAIETFDLALSAWVARRFDEAQTHFERVLTLWPNDYPSRKYLTEIETFKAQPPGPQWDGVSSLTSK